LNQLSQHPPHLNKYLLKVWPFCDIIVALGEIMRRWIEAGIGLVEVTIALGLAGVLVLVLMKLGEQQTALQKKATRNVELTEVYNHFVSMIDSQSACDATFGSAKLGDSIDEFRINQLDPNQAPFAKVDQAFQATNIIIEEMKILTNSDIQKLINTGKYPGLTQTTVNTDPYGFAMIQFWVKFNRGKNAGAQSQSVAKLFTIPVVMAQYHQTSGIMAFDAKDHCLTTLKGRVADENMNTAGPNYQNTGVTEPAFPHATGWGAHCLVVDSTIPISSMEIAKCRSNKP
jgi:type II secretory pathway pseudopilin PulG